MACKTPLSESNLFNFGSDLEYNIKKAAAECEDAWRGSGQQGGTLKIWRIEKFKVNHWPESEYGRFYNGDSYILLHTFQKPGGRALGWDIHFWIGSKSTQDEYGTAAYKTVELDDFLNRAAAQHREVEGYESPLFTSYFPSSLEILEGGIDSGFNHVEAVEYKPRLLHVKGVTNNLRVMQVGLSSNSLNDGDAFILDNGLTVYQWNGKGANWSEKQKANQICKTLRAERGGKPDLLLFDQGEKDSDLPAFWELLGGEGPIAHCKEADEAVAQSFGAARLFRLSDASGALTFQLEQEGPYGTLSRSGLDPNDVWVLDSGPEVFVWVGKGSSFGEKKNALGYANEYLIKNGRPAYLPISKIVDGGENELFEMCFKDGNFNYSDRSRDIDFNEPERFHTCCPHHVRAEYDGAPSELADLAAKDKAQRAQERQEMAGRIAAFNQPQPGYIPGYSNHSAHADDPYLQEKEAKKKEKWEKTQKKLKEKEKKKKDKKGKDKDKKCDKDDKKDKDKKDKDKKDKDKKDKDKKDKDKDKKDKDKKDKDKKDKKKK